MFLEASSVNTNINITVAKFPLQIFIFMDGVLTVVYKFQVVRPRYQLKSVKITVTVRGLFLECDTASMESQFLTFQRNAEFTSSRFQGTEKIDFPHLRLSKMKAQWSFEGLEIHYPNDGCHISEQWKPLSHTVTFHSVLKFGITELEIHLNPRSPPISLHHQCKVKQISLTPQDTIPSKLEIENTRT